MANPNAVNPHRLRAVVETLPPQFIRVLDALDVSIARLIAAGYAEKLQDPEYQKALEDELWYQGNLRYLLRPSSQTKVDDFTASWKEDHPGDFGPIVWTCHRGGGKSFGLLKLGVARCLQKPGQIARFISPTAVQTKAIITEPVETLLQHCPKELIPKKSYNSYRFFNPRWKDPNAYSVLYLHGCKEEAGSLRGPRSDLILLDEMREVDAPRYVVENVLIPHFVGREHNDPLMVLSSSVPDSGAHEFCKFEDEAERDGRWIKQTVDDNEDFGEDAQKRYLKVYKSKKSPAWRREMGCERVSDPTRMIIPEFATEELKRLTIVDDYPRPKWYWPHLALDLGWEDNQAALFGYVDFAEQTLVIEDEIVVHYKSIGQMAEAIKAKERDLYGEGAAVPAPHKDGLGGPIIRRFGDNDKLELANLRIDHGIPISPADKHDVATAVANLRSKFQAGKVRILARCKLLIKQLENGLRDASGKFERSDDPEMGHCDAIAALVYLNRMINWRVNPAPFAPYQDDGSTFIRRQPLQRSGNITITRQPLIVTGRS